MGIMQSFYQGFFLAPTVTAGALKGAVFAANIYEPLGFDVLPDGQESRHDIIQAVTFGTPEGVIAFCRGIQAAAPVETPYVRTALENLEQQVLQCWDGMEEPSAARLEADYLQTLELTLRELRQAEEAGEETSGRAALCLRAVNVLSQVISDAGQLQREWSQRSLEAEVEALERLAAMRGDIGGMGEA